MNYLIIQLKDQEKNRQRLWNLLLDILQETDIGPDYLNIIWRAKSVTIMLTDKVMIDDIRQQFKNLEYIVSD